MSRRMAVHPLDTISLRSLRIFIAVVEAGTLSAAARQLHLALSTVSKSLAALEEAVGYPLIYRNTRRLALTDAGRAFYRRSRAVVREMEEAASVDLAGGSPLPDVTGHLRVVVSPSFGDAVLAPALPQFLERHPRVTIDVFVTSAMPNLVRERIDVAIMMREYPETKTASVRLAPNARVICAAPRYLERFGMPAVPQDLADHRCIVSLLSGVAEAWHLIGPDGSSAPAPLGAVVASNDGNFLKRACLAGQGIGNLFAFHIHQELKDGRLVEVLRDHKPENNNVLAIYPHQRIVQPHVRAFVDFVRDTIGDPPFWGAA